MRRSPVLWLKNTQSFDINHAGIRLVSRGIIRMMDSEYLWDRGTRAVASVLCERAQETGEKRDEEYVQGGRSKKLEDTISIMVCEIRLLFFDRLCWRIRAGFDGTFPEESYSLVMTAWDDRMDGLMNRFRRRVRPVEQYSRMERRRQS